THRMDHSDGERPHPHAADDGDVSSAGSVPARVDSVAARLSRLLLSPPASPSQDLVTPVLASLPLHRVLQLLRAPSATPALIAAARSSRGWAALLGPPAAFARVLRVAVSLDRVALLWTRRRWISMQNSVANDRSNMRGPDIADDAKVILDAYAGDAAVTAPPDAIIGTLEAAFLEDFKSLLSVHAGRVSFMVRGGLPANVDRNYNSAIGDWMKGMSLAKLMAICAYIPADAFGKYDNAVSRCELCRLDPSDTFCVSEQTSRVYSLRGRSWDAESAQTFLELHIVPAWKQIYERKAYELEFLADLYEEYHPELRPIDGPQSTRTNPAHTTASLRWDAVRVKKMHVRPKLRRFRRGVVNDRLLKELPEWYRFSEPYPTLVPYSWCFHLFKQVCGVSRSADPNVPDTADSLYRYLDVAVPAEIATDFERAKEHFQFVFERHHPSGEPRKPRFDTKSGIRSYEHVISSFLPSPQEELDWLGSFVRCIRWMRSEFPELVLKAKEAGHFENLRALIDPADIKDFIERQPPRMVAHQLRADSELCRNADEDLLPSLVALYMPPYRSEVTKKVAGKLFPKHDATTRQLMYEELIKSLKRCIQKAPKDPEPLDGYQLVADQLSQDSPQNGGQEPEKGTDSWEQSVDQYIQQRREAPQAASQRLCYICRMAHTSGHKVFPAMCEPCGEFNLAGSRLSLPENLDLRGRTALVTGARVNLGFHTALRLLRCGARVIASTRYPQDAVARFEAEPDSTAWSDRLRVIGADFRDSRHAFALAAAVRDLVASTSWAGGSGTLDILINNAAQTLVDAPDAEHAAVEREDRLRDARALAPAVAASPMLVDNGYVPAARAVRSIPGAPAAPRAITAPTDIAEGDPDANNSGPAALASSLPAPTKSSWVQSLSEIPYDDVITAHSVNTFVPLILVRELLPIMGTTTTSAGASTYAAGHIINVSSREGLFEQSPRRSGAKNARHVHTNMSKAGLNMITETEATAAWRARRVAVNSVDPGYMSAAPEVLRSRPPGEPRPLSWEDGAARVLWPVAVAERAAASGSNAPVPWGRFLKHYGAARVD
ncbi:hypothetical protein HK405_007475, partial [Cladochytrium tenue]